MFADIIFFLFQFVLAFEFGVRVREDLSAGAASTTGIGIYFFSASFHVS